jgi:hypothetical protein
VDITFVQIQIHQPQPGLPGHQPALMYEISRSQTSGKSLKVLGSELLNGIQ